MAPPARAAAIAAVSTDSWEPEGWRALIDTAHGDAEADDDDGARVPRRRAMPVERPMVPA